MAVVNQLVTPSWVMKTVGRRVVNNTVFAGNVARSYDDQYKINGAKVGDTVAARLPQRYTVGSGPVMTPQPIVDRTVPITLTDQKHVGIEFTSASLTMFVDDYRERYIEPAVDQLIQEVDGTGLQRMYKQVNAHVGVPGVPPGSTGTLPQSANQPYLDAGVKLDDMSVAMDNRVAMLSSNMHVYLANGNIAVFNPVASITKQYRKGQFGDEALGIAKWFKTQNVFRHTIGNPGGTPVVDGAGQTGTSINVRGMTITTGTWKDGDVVTFAGSNAVNPMSRNDTGQLLDQLIQGDVTADGAGKAALTVYPGITLTGALQTCTASPADGAQIKTFGAVSTYWGVTTPQGVIYDPDAFALVMADLEQFQGIWISERISNKALGVALRFHKGADVTNDTSPARIDGLYGWAKVRDFACRVSGCILLAASLSAFHATPAHAQRLLTNTTISAAISNVTDPRITITVASATGIAANQFLFIENEVSRVVSVSGTNVLIQRGVVAGQAPRGLAGAGSMYAGFNYRSHPSGAVVWVSAVNAPDDFHGGDPDYKSTCTRGTGQAAVLPWINIVTGTTWNCRSTNAWNGTNDMPVTFNSRQTTQP